MIQLVPADGIAHHRRAVVSQALEALPVAALQVVGQVVAYLRREATLGGCIADVHPAQLQQRRAESRRRGLQFDERAERVEQDRADRGHATNCQVANCVVNSPSRTADAAATRAVALRSSHTTAIHMKIGNRTTRKRGSDINGCGSTG